MQVVILPDAAAVSRRAADLVAGLVAARAARGLGAVLGLAAGATPVGLYRELSVRRAAGLDFSRVSAFGLDEYLGLPADHPALFARFFREQVPACDLHVLDGGPGGGLAELTARCAEFEQDIGRAGGVDLQILGLGGNGHVAFNEPGSSLAGRTRPVALSPATRAANAAAFPPGEPVPEAALTQGIGTILEARRILLLATGPAKAAAVAAALEGPVSARLPASALQMHPDVAVLLDEAAATGLALRAQYDAEADLRRRLAL